MSFEPNFQSRFTDRGEVKRKLRTGELSSILDYRLTTNAFKILEFLKSADLSIESSLKSNSTIKLFDHQILAAKKMRNEFGGTGILADEVGLGKTIEAGIIIKEFLISGLAKSILILAPPSLIYQWQSEMETKFDLKFFQKEDNDFVDASSHDLLIFSHSGAVYENQKRLLTSRNWDMVIVDEAHSLKNAETLKYKLVKDLSRKYTILLSATPIQNNLLELYTMVDLIRPGMLGTKTNFKNKYADDRQMRRVNPMFKEELQKILSQLIIRTTRQEVKKYIKFTDRIPNTNILKPTDDERLLYNRITSKIREIFEDGGSGLFLVNVQKFISSSTLTSKRAVMHMYENKLLSKTELDDLLNISERIEIDTKAKKLMEIIRTRNDEKFLVFTEYRLTQDYLESLLSKSGFRVVVFNGSMTLEERKEAVELFRGGYQIMISTSAGGEGQNFQFCSNVVNYDLPWNPMKVEQRVGRVHRIGQERDVNIFNLAYEKTIDAYILELLYTKIQLFTMTLGHLDLLFEDITDEESGMQIFKEYITSKDENDAEKRFSALGEKWFERKNNVELIEGLNSEVFANFSFGDDKDE